MLTYDRLALAAVNRQVDLGDPAAVQEVNDYLCDQWIGDYRRLARKTEIVEVRQLGFQYLFDIRAGRLIAAWGQSRGRDGHVRDKTRMAGHPLGGPVGYHRGHAIPHRLGGGVDINLVPQDGAVNIGPFRELEREAVATPHALYFTYWIYGPGPSDAKGAQRPVGSQQGLLKPGGTLQLRNHHN